MEAADGEGSGNYSRHVVVVFLGAARTVPVIVFLHGLHPCILSTLHKVLLLQVLITKKKKVLYIKPLFLLTHTGVPIILLTYKNYLMQGC